MKIFYKQLPNTDSQSMLGKICNQFLLNSQKEPTTMVSNNDQSKSLPDVASIPLSPSMRLLAMTFSIGAALGSGIVWGITHANSQVAQQALPPQAEVQPTTRAEYERLKTGMPLSEVETILDPGVEIARSETAATFVWENPDGSKITATFKNDKLESKAQSQLK